MEMEVLFPGPDRVEHYIQIQDFSDPNEDACFDSQLLSDGKVNGCGDSQGIHDNVNTAKEVRSLKYAVDQEKYAHILNIRSISNLGIFASYFGIGFVASFTKAPLQYYLISSLDASSQQYSVYTVMHRLPWSVKFVFGLVSDAIPIMGYRRKPWLMIGWLGFVCCNMVLMGMRYPGIVATIMLSFLFTCFVALADVCTDTLCVERAVYESDDCRGRLQSFGYIVSSTGRVLGAVMGTFLYDSDFSWSLSISQVFLVNGIIPVVGIGFLIWPLIEICSSENVYRLGHQLNQVWEVVQLRAVWRPMIFLFTYASLQVPNSAWYNYLVWGLGFSSADLGYLTIVSAVISCLGYVVFDLFLFRSSWRMIFFWTSFVSFAVSMLQLLLIFGMNKEFGVPNIMMAVGHDAVIALMEGLHAMPKFIMFVMLCPEGVEGTSFALLTTMTSVGTTVAYEIGSLITGIWDVSNETLAAGDYTGIIKLNVLTSCLQMMPLCLICLLPDNRASRIVNSTVVGYSNDYQDEQQRSIDERAKSKTGGTCLLATLFFSLVATLLPNILKLA